MVAGSVTDRQARRFLQTGKFAAADVVSPAELVARCDSLIRFETQKSSARAVKLARKFVRYCEKEPQLRASLQIALRALAWALHSSSQWDEARAVYLRARRLVQREPALRARIDRILIDVYMYLGQPGEAMRRAKLSIATFQKLRDSLEEAKTRINYGNLFHRRDRHREAQREYTKALKRIGSDKSHRLLEGLCLYNLANTEVQLFSFDAAQEHYQRGRANFLELGYDLYANECDYGLAWLHMLCGDYHDALTLLSDCETVYRNAGQKKGVMLCALDRAEAYLGLNLLSDAYQAARQAERASGKLGLRYERSKAAFFLAKAAFALGKDREMRPALRRAIAGFKAEQNHGFETAARFFLAQLHKPGAVRLRKMREARKKFAQAQLPLWEAVCDLQLAQSERTPVQVVKRLKRNKAVHAVPHLYAQWQTQIGDHAFAEGKRSLAAKSWANAAATLEAVRAKLPPVEIRSTFSRSNADPYRRLIEHHLTNDTELAALWAERLRTVGVWSVRKNGFPNDSRRDEAARLLDELTTHLAALTGQLQFSEGSRTAIGARVQEELRSVERSARDGINQITHKLAGTVQSEDTLIRAFQRTSQKHSIIQFTCLERDLLAFVHERGATRAVRLAGGVSELRALVGVWQILLNRRLTTSGTKITRTDLADEAALMSNFGEKLWEPLNIRAGQKDVLLIPDGQLSAAPWQGMVVQGDALIDRHRITLAPSLQHYLHAKKSETKSEQKSVFIGDTTGLSGHVSELAEILRSDQGATVHNPCSRADWPSAGQWDQWHFAGHAQYRADNPFYSSLALTDGPLFAADLRLRDCRVNLVTLAACRTGYGSTLPGDESTGLVRAFLEMGARNIIASQWTVADRSTTHWMRAFYSSVHDGASTPTAVGEACQITREKYPSVYHWAPFALFGAG